MFNWFAFLFTFAALYIVADISSIPRANAHDAPPTAAMPLGWSYPFNCCSNTDCHQIKSTAIHEAKTGYVINATGELISYGDKRLKDSPDGLYHQCTVQGKTDTKTLCLFVPPPSY